MGRAGIIGGHQVDHARVVELRPLLDDSHTFLNEIILDICVLDGFDLLEYLFGGFVHFFQQFEIFLLLELIKFPLPLVRINHLDLLQIMLDLTVNPIDIHFDQLMLRFLFVCSVLAKLIQNVERLLTDIHLEIVPVVLPHEILQFFPGEYFGQLSE